MPSPTAGGQAHGAVRDEPDRRFAQPSRGVAISIDAVTLGGRRRTL